MMGILDVLKYSTKISSIAGNLQGTGYVTGLHLSS
jgi:hypothetical protein